MPSCKEASDAFVQIRRTGVLNEVDLQMAVAKVKVIDLNQYALGREPKERQGVSGLDDRTLA